VQISVFSVSLWFIFKQKLPQEGHTLAATISITNNDTDGPDITWKAVTQLDTS
jgi:hypothetical protein